MIKKSTLKKNKFKKVLIFLYCFSIMKVQIRDNFHNYHSFHSVREQKDLSIMKNKKILEWLDSSIFVCSII